MAADNRTTITLRTIGKQAEITVQDEDQQTLATINLDEAAIAQTLDTFSAFQKRYQDRPNRLQDKEQAQLRELGSDLFDWLNQQASLAQMIDAMPTVPWLVEFCITGRPETELEKAFLHLPWEILTTDGQFLAARDDLQYNPVRRIGNKSAPKPPSDKRLAMMFMAASPDNSGGARLDYEQEENAILQACGYTRHNKLDFYVEESGSLQQLKEEISLVKGVDIVHLSCHGTNQTPPKLVLEDEVGAAAYAEARAVAQALRSNNGARLLVLSACHSASSSDNAEQPMSSELVMAGLPALIGMSGAVSDVEASGFTAALYQNLASGQSIELALADARAKAVNPVSRNEAAYDWHLPRLLMRKNGGGVIATGSQSRNALLTQHGSKESFGDKANPVASRYEFVGRRKQIQHILRAWRGGKRNALITGLGRQGKSSLALRLAHRLPHYQLVAIYQDYQPLRILQAIKISYNTRVVSEIIERFEAQIQSSPGNEQLFADCTAEIISIEADKHKPLLLVVDDLESALTEGSAQQSLHLVKDQIVRQTLAALVRVFHQYQGEARLLFTSRYEFSLTDRQGKDWAQFLHHEPLPPMSGVESRKQFQLKLLQQKQQLPDQDSQLWSLVERIRMQAKGSPGLQDFVFSLLYEKPEAVENVLAELDAYHQTGAAPDDQALNTYFQNLALEGLLDLLTPAQQQVLSGLTLFDIPVPQSVFTVLVDACVAKVADGQRLLALGLCDAYPQRDATYVMIHPLLRPKAEVLSDESKQLLAAEVLPVLWQEWQGERSDAQSLQLLELAVSKPDKAIVAACCEDGLYYLYWTLQRLGQAQELAIAVMQLAEDTEIKFKASTLSWLGQVLTTAPNQQQRVKYCYELALQQAKGEEFEAYGLGAIRYSYAGWLKQNGDIEAALTQLELAKEECLSKNDEKSYVAVLGEIASIHLLKSEVDSALALYEEELAVYESLGDQRSRAIRQREVAQIFVYKGKISSALLLHDEGLKVFEFLGDRRERAITLRAIARIRESEGEVDSALLLHEECKAAFESLGDQRESAITLANIARICEFKGEVDSALLLHEECKAVFESLGDQRERAVALGDIARIRMSKGDVDSALSLHEEELKVYESLGDIRSVAITYWDLVQIDLALKNYELACEKLLKAWGIVESIADVPSMAPIGNLLGQLLIHYEQLDQATSVLLKTQTAMRQLGQTDQADQLQFLLDQCESKVL